MHEASVAQSIVSTVLNEAQKQDATRIESIEIDVGELTSLGIDQVRFWMETSFQGTIAENAEIVFRSIPTKLHCLECNFQGPVATREDPAHHLRLPSFACPECQSPRIEITQGKETIIRKIKILKD